mmetsp:Transcript_10006/g.16608  ORF Transcript_10006/g.16608 Transcript_10006/m.16608 type:complete len:419 (+) Transcript_10006:335-1591(+)
MTSLLLERQVFTQVEVDLELWGESDEADSDIPKFNVGAEVQVKKEDSRLRWRKPHLRCPGYVFQCVGRVEKYIGKFDDPFFMAFRGQGPKQHLYTVSFAARDLWREGHDNDSSSSGVEVEDRVTLEVYEGWLQLPSEAGVSQTDGMGRDMFSSNRGVGVIGSGDKSIFPEGSHDHSHSHSHSSDTSSLPPPPPAHDHSHDHNHDHVHESRVTVECRAVDNEEPESAGQRVGHALIRLLISKGIITSEDIRTTVCKLESFSDKLLGADLVVKAWMDEAFRARLLSDAPSAAMEVDVVTSNANAPTVLQVVACTPQIHHVCVCTLCSCYPSGLLGLSPAWYRSRSYRARTIREPRKVLAEFGTILDSSVAVHVHDSTADCRFMVLPLRPEGTEGWSAEELRALVTRDSMIGISQIKLPDA